MTSHIRLKIFSIEDVGCHIFTFIRLNGKKAVMLVDTGASHTAFDKKRIKRFVPQKRFRQHNQFASGLGSARIKSHIVPIGKISIGKLQLNNYLAVLLDLTIVNKTYKRLKVPPVDGVLGSDILYMFNTAIDYGKKRIVFKY